MGSRQEPRRLSRLTAGVGHGKGTSWCLCSSNEDLVQPMKEALHSCAAQVGKLHFAAHCRAEQWSGAECTQHHEYLTFLHKRFWGKKKSSALPYSTHGCLQHCCGGAGCFVLKDGAGGGWGCELDWEGAAV